MLRSGLQYSLNSLRFRRACPGSGRQVEATCTKIHPGLGSPLRVYPGGISELNHRRGEKVESIYSAQNTRAAYQLNWSLSLFGKSELPEPNLWQESLGSAVEPDGVRILNSSIPRGNVIQFLISSQPAIAPSVIVRSVKGRLQYLIRDQSPKAFRRNYHIQSIGEANDKVLGGYVNKQTGKHPMADARVQALLEAIQFHDADIDLAKPNIGTYGQYLNSIHVVIENADGWNEIRKSQLERVRDMIIGSARKKSWQLSRIGLLANHIHVLVGAAVTESSESVAISLMNNIAYVYEMKPILKFSYYAGTFGGYDRGAVR